MMQRCVSTTRFIRQRIRLDPFSPMRLFSSNLSSRKELLNSTEVDEYLSKPTWSVKSLLPTEQQIDESTEVTTGKLHHLLRLSALSLPPTPEEEAEMLRDLRAQLHFVKEIQKIDTEGVEPMKSIRGESTASQNGEEITLDSMKVALGQEELIGNYHKRIRRRHITSSEAADSENWDVLGQAPNKVGRFFVVHATGT